MTASIAALRGTISEVMEEADTAFAETLVDLGAADWRAHPT